MERQDAERLASIVALGVTFGDPIDPQPSGCSSCIWHVESKDGQYEDGGTASAILSWIKEGYLGDPNNLVLRPVRHPQ
jgi:hypothetical protein